MLSRIDRDNDWAPSDKSYLLAIDAPTGSIDQALELSGLNPQEMPQYNKSLKKLVIAEAGSYLAMLGKKPLLVWDTVVKDIVGDAVLRSATEARLEPVDAAFQGEATKEEAERLAQLARDEAADIAVGIGGGKAIDVAKAVAFDVGTKLMTIPTIAATDAPTSGSRATSRRARRARRQ